MSSIKKSLAFDQYFWNTYIDHSCGNLSQYIRKYVILGVEAEVNKIDDYRKRVLELTREIDSLKTLNKTLKGSLESLKARSEKVESYDSIVSKYGLNDKHIEKLKSASEIIHKDAAFFNGQFNRFKNDTGFNMKRSHFDFLIKSINRGCHDE
jgi:hypothetical protein